MAALATLLLGLQAMAQPEPPPQEKVKALKIAFLTERLELTPKEAQQFWPVYNAFEDEILSVNLQERKILRGFSAGQSTDEEAEEQIRKLTEIRSKRNNLESRFLRDMQKVLPPAKVAKLVEAEEEFKRRLLRRLGDRQGMRRRN